MTDTFKDYQDWRERQEQEVKRAMRDWAMLRGPDLMTIEQVRSLESASASIFNQTTREAFEIGRATKSETTT